MIPIKYVKASEIWYDLNDYFEEDLKQDASGYTRDWYGFMMPKGEKDTRVGLAKRRKLMITRDTPSNSILVANASPSQLLEIGRDRHVRQEAEHRLGGSPPDAGD